MKKLDLNSFTFWMKVRMIYRFPQYLLFLIELLSVVLVAIFFLIFYYNRIFTFHGVGFLLFDICLAFFFFFLFKKRKNLDYDFIRKKDYELFQESTSKILKRITIVIIVSFFIISLIYFLLQEYGKISIIIQILLCLISLLEFIISAYKISPFFFYLLLSIPLVLASNIGIQNGIITWSLLSFILISVGSNFFDVRLMKRYLKIEIEDDSLIEKKINYLIGILFLFLGLLISEQIYKISIYRIFVVNHFAVYWLWNSLIKIFIIFNLSVIWQHSRRRFTYLVLSFIGRKEIKKIDGRYRLVEINKEKWLSSSNSFLIESCKDDVMISDIPHIHYKYKVLNSDVKRLVTDVIEVRGNIFVRENSYLIYKIGSQTRDFGYSLLGKPLRALRDLFVFFLFLFVVVTALLFSTTDPSVDGPYVRVVLDSKNQSPYLDWNDIITVEDEKIYINGRLISLDSQKLSFESDNIYGNIQQSNLYIFNREVESGVSYIRVGSNRFNKFVKKQMDKDVTKTWIINKDETEKTKNVVLEKKD